jgi:hypothetical protein
MRPQPQISFILGETLWESAAEEIITDFETA